MPFGQERVERLHERYESRFVVQLMQSGLDDANCLIVFALRAQRDGLRDDIFIHLGLRRRQCIVRAHHDSRLGFWPKAVPSPVQAAKSRVYVRLTSSHSAVARPRARAVFAARSACRD